jgi:hypothetical protein
MASENTNILSLFKPTIQLDEIAIRDVESDAQDIKVSDDHARPSKIVGNIAPYVKVNGYVFDHNDILDMSLFETGFLPTMTITIRDSKGVFKSAYFPKTKPVLGLYIMSKHDKLKCVRCDFLIRGIFSDSSIDPMDQYAGKNMELTFDCVLMVPNLYDNKPKSYPGMTSYDALRDVATEMQLGFATNENYTNDKMTWLKPLTSKVNFIQHVMVRAFKDDSSFYHGFIDKYYHLNFVNMSTALAEDGDLSKVYNKLITYADIYESDGDAQQSAEPADLVLTNFSKMAKSDAFIYEYRPETSSGGKLLKSGYERSVSYYDQQLTRNPATNIVSLDVRPLTTTLLPGKSDESDDRMKKFSSNLSYGEWCGIDYNNGHDNFNYAQIQNEHNNNEVRKITMQIKMKGMNLNLTRGMRVPVIIIRENASETATDFESRIPEEDAARNDTEKSDELGIIKDKWLSGFYVVDTITYMYDARSGFMTEASLLRMNWNQPEAVMKQKK